MPKLFFFSESEADGSPPVPWCVLVAGKGPDEGLGTWRRGVGGSPRCRTRERDGGKAPDGWTGGEKARGEVRVAIGLDRAAER